MKFSENQILKTTIHTKKDHFTEYHQFFITPVIKVTSRTVIKYQSLLSLPKVTILFFRR